jgi:tetrapyrrole methylase family protein/MazG family protein
MTEVAKIIHVVGLGPGDASLLTVAARDVLASAREVWLRTARHPTVAGLPAGPVYRSFDDEYERGDSFADVYERIVARLLDLARAGEVVYAVPGHPLFGEATVGELMRRADGAGIAVRIHAGVSFFGAAAQALGIDPLAGGMLLLDALELDPRGRGLAPQRPTLIAQVYDRHAASQAKLALLEAYPPDHPVRIVSQGGVHERSLADLDRADGFDHLTTLYVPPLAATDDVRTFEGLRAIVARLRAPDGGCPWDLQQTHETLKRFLLEEAYEALEALDEGAPARMAEELGDLMMQVLLHAQIAEDGGEFAVEDVISSIARKLVRRHPHVFGEGDARTAEEVLANWEVLKKDERGGGGALDAVPKAMPALAMAQSVQGRAESAGHGATPPDSQRASEALRALAAGTLGREALGELLFGIVGMARASQLDAEEALRMAVGAFRERVREAEGSAG